MLMVIFKKEMKNIGMNFVIPKCSSVVDTYQYRWFKTFWDRCKRDNMNIEMAEQLIKSLIRYAKSNNILNRGTSLLFRDDIIDICISDLSKKKNERIDYIKILIDNHKKYNRDDLIDYLLSKKHRDGYSTLFMLREGKQIDDCYISLSKKCLSAYLKLSSNEKDHMLSLLEYNKLKYRLLSVIGYKIIISILGSDVNVKL